MSRPVQLPACAAGRGGACEVQSGWRARAKQREHLLCPPCDPGCANAAAPVWAAHSVGSGGPPTAEVDHQRGHLPAWAGAGCIVALDLQGEVPALLAGRSVELYDAVGSARQEGLLKTRHTAHMRRACLTCHPCRLPSAPAGSGRRRRHRERCLVRRPRSCSVGDSGEKCGGQGK